MVSGEGRQVVDVHMDLDEAALQLHHTVGSLLCILLVIEEEEASCLVRVDEVDVQNHDGEHVLLGENTSLPALNLSLVMNGIILVE